MNGEWTNRLSALVKNIGNFAKANKPVATAFHNLEVATRENKVLDAKTHELIALAVAVTTRCDGCISKLMRAQLKKQALQKKKLRQL
ncbi:carboxymuconolactone decarboxylase family protein [Acinetobacter pittii]